MAGACLAVLAVAAPPALAARRAYVAGAYAGRVRQSIPHTYTGSIGFDIHGSILTNLHFRVDMVCGKFLLAQVTSPPSPVHVKVNPAGAFAYSGTMRGAHVDLRGKLQGRSAKGTFFESFHTSPQNACTMYRPAPFGAGH